ncbi:MAG: Hpt domain-containing protein [Oscillospiraceae bacterium]|nr:Hpt domain-containing protein [Oscillospiraceae bacterium]
MYENEIEISEIKIRGIDAEAGGELFCGESDLYIDALRSYVRHTPAALDKLRVVSEDSLSEYETNVHGLKGSSGGIGAGEVRKAAADLESKAKSGDFTDLPSMNEELIRKAETLVSDISVWLEKLR